ncbi:RNA-directed DNA polymerase, eukaryota [Tanacetum coccineum]
MDSSVALEKFINHIRVGSWFSYLKPASNSFVSDERIVWISIEGLPLKVWSHNTFVKVASKWGELVEWENIEEKKFSRKQLCYRTKLNDIICERFKVIIQGKVHWVCAKEMESWDPLFRNEAYDSSSSDEEDECENEGSLNGDNNESDKKVDRVSESSCMHRDALFYDNSNNKSMASELKYRPGFTPMESTVNEVQEKEMEVTTEEVGQTMGYNMEGCMKNIEAIIDSQGDRNVETKMERMKLVTINKLWGNTSYDYAFSSSLDFDKILDQGGSNKAIINDRSILLKELQDIISMESEEVAQKAKVRSSIEADEFTNRLSLEQQEDLERNVTIEEIKRAVWDYAAVMDFFSLADLISDVQSAFVSNRQILDGSFILNEFLSWCKYKKFKAMVFKVDFEKAFDSISWDYLDDVLKKFGFGDKWCGWINGCLKSAKGLVLLNGSPTPEFQFHKGLKQGDP